jgi:hypothetical protein
MDLAQAVDLYLETRRGLGFSLVQVGVELRGLVRYAQQAGHTGPLTTSLAIQWAQQPQHCDRVYWATRLHIVRRLAQPYPCSKRRDFTLARPSLAPGTVLARLPELAFRRR